MRTQNSYRRLKMFRRILLTALCISPLAHAAAPKEEFNPKKIDQIIHEAYKNAMERRFVEFINIAKKQKNAAEFFGEINRLPEQGRKDLRDLLKDTPTPRLLPVHNGIKFTLNDQSVTVEFTDKLGEIKMNGTRFEIPAGKTLRQLASQEAETAYNWPIQFFSEAHAGALSAVGKLAWGTIKYSAAGTAVGTALGYGIGAAEGCLISIHTKPAYKSFSEACGDGASTGAEYLVSAVGGIVFSGLGGYWGYGEGAWNLSWDERTALQNAGKTFKPMLWRGIKLAGTAGAIAMLIHGANELSYMNGAVVKCEYHGNGYKVTGLNGGAQKALYDSAGDGISLGWGYLKSPEELAKNMGTRFPQSTDEQRKIVSQQIWTEHLAMSDTCKKNPGKEYRIRSSDAKKIAEPPGPPAETKQ